MLYQGVVLGILISLTQFLFERRRVSETVEAAKNALLTFLLIYSFVFTVPTTVDRAYFESQYFSHSKPNLLKSPH
jgi:hypothetical protein